MIVSTQPTCPFAYQSDAHRRRRGFTLIEVLIAITLVVVLGAMIISGSGMLGGNRLRAAAGLFISGIRFASSKATTTGNAVRMVFDLDAHAFVIEMSEDQMLRVKETDNKKESEGASAGAEAANEAEQEAIEYASSLVKGPRAPRARFKPVPQFSDEGSGRTLGAGIMYDSVQTEHDAKPRKKGRAYLYFWPGGATERAAIHIVRKGDPEGLTILVNPLTGRARIERGKVELEDSRSEADFGVREEEE